MPPPSPTRREEGLENNMPQNFDLLLDALGQILNIGHTSVDRISFWVYMGFTLRGVLLVLNKFM